MSLPDDKCRKVEKSKSRHVNRSSLNHHDVDLSTFRRVDFSASAPDLTRSIMGRLGYMKVSPAVARRRRIRQWGTRAGLALSAMIAIAIGLQVYENGPTIRKPVGPTIPSATNSTMSSSWSPCTCVSLSQAFASDTSPLLKAKCRSRKDSISRAGLCTNRMPSAVRLRPSSRGMDMALRQGDVGTSSAYCQLLIQPSQSRRPSDVGTSLHETAA